MKLLLECLLCATVSVGMTFLRYAGVVALVMLIKGCGGNCDESPNPHPVGVGDSGFGGCAVPSPMTTRTNQP